jgi:hypothetical protein
MTSFERSLLGLFSACWIVALLELFGALRLAGGWPLSLYGLYGTGAFLGWVAGNVWVQRRRRVARPLARWLLMVYLFGPPSLLYLLRALAPAEHRAAAPLVPLYAFVVYAIFFLVPVSLPPRPRRPFEDRDDGRPRDGG